MVLSRLRVGVHVLLVLLLTPSLAKSQKQSCAPCHSGKTPDQLVRLLKGQATPERGVATMDKGQIGNYLGNYGVLSNYLEYFNDAIHWPAAASTSTQYCFGLGLIVATPGNVVTSVVGGPSQKVDWSPKVGSRGKIFSGDVTAPPPDETPFLALSDNPQTWPEGYFDEQSRWVSTPGKRHWPGRFRIDIDPQSANYGKEVEGEFVSDRDIYCVFDDNENSSSKGTIGIEVEQTAYTYGRPYAEDLLFWDFTIRNTSGKRADSVYVGYYAIFRVDYDNQDLVHILDSSPSDGHANGDFVYVWDKNNTKDGAWANDLTALGIVGLNVLETPKNMGVTDFHFFNREVAPKVDEEMWPIISSNRNDPYLVNPSAIFHGANRRMDTTHPDSMAVYFPTGANINFFIMTGPFSLSAGETVRSSVAVVMGNAGSVPNKPDTTDLMNNMRTAQQMYARKFQGSGAPQTPRVTATPGDRQVRLAWDAEAENSRDALTGKPNFEGYKIYRSDDLGKTWGTPISDAYGNLIGFKPIKIYDLVDGIKGTDPAFNQSLGDDSGLQHSYVDEGLTNGVEYWYCVTSYSKGNQNKDSLEQSYQSPLGRSTMQSNTVSAIPGAKPTNYIPPRYDPQTGTGGAVPAIGGISQGLVTVDIVSPEQITGDNYLIRFVDSAKQVVGGKTNYVLGFNLYRISASRGDTTLLLDHHLFSDKSGDNLPIVDGFRLKVQNSPSGTEWLGWTKVNGDTSTFDWRTKAAPKYQNRPPTQVLQETIYTLDDFRITIDTTLGGGIEAQWFDYFTEKKQPETQHLPIRVDVVTDPSRPIDVSSATWLFDFAVKAPWDTYRQFYYSPLGWDIIPGGKGYTAGSPGFYEMYPDVLNLERLIVDPVTGDTTHTGLYLYTNNFPDVYVNAEGDTIRKPAVAPSHGDQFTIRTYKPFRKEISYAFTTKRLSYSQPLASDLDKIRVVPDPYIVSNEWETNQFGKKLMFNHVPNQCTINIYTVAGDRIATVDHNDNNGFVFWDMKTYNDQYVAYGLYLYVLTTPDGQTKVGKFLIIK